MSSFSYLEESLTQQLLDFVAQQTYRDLPFEDGRYIPTLVDLRPGASEVKRLILEARSEGAPAFLSNAAESIPLVDHSLSSDRYRVFMSSASFGHSFQEQMAMEFSPETEALLSDQKMQLTIRWLDEAADKFAALGKPSIGETGLINDPNVQVEISSVDLYNSSTTAETIYEFFIDKIKLVNRTSNYTEMPGDILVPYDLYFLLVKRKVADANVSVLHYLTSNLASPDMPLIKSIRPATVLSYAALEAEGVQPPNTGKDRIVFYSYDRFKIERHTTPPQLMPPDFWPVKDGRKIIPLYKSYTPTIVTNPTSLLYVDISKES